MNAARCAFTPCPYCGGGPYRSLGKHTFEKHGRTADSVRKSLGLSMREWHDLNQAGKTAMENA